VQNGKESKGVSTEQVLGKILAHWTCTKAPGDQGRFLRIWGKDMKCLSEQEDQEIEGGKGVRKDGGSCVFRITTVVVVRTKRASEKDSKVRRKKKKKKKKKTQPKPKKKRGGRGGGGGLFY